jgi:SSS family solute:Na+ symporter
MLTVLDWTIIVVYVGAMVVVGILFRGKQETVNDYFTARGSLGGWLGQTMVGLSIAATLFSGISFIAYPSIIYEHGTPILVAILQFPLMYVVLRFWFLPRFLAMEDAEPYGIIERRFGSGARTMAAILYVLLRVGWMAVLIYAPAKAIGAAAGLDERGILLVTVVIGLSSTLYTSLGGIRGVIITDALQFFVIAVGIFLAIAFAAANINAGFGEAVAFLGESGRLEWPSFDLSFITRFTIYAMLVGQSMEMLGSYTADQMSLQRYLSTGSARSASRSFLINCIGATIILLMLAAIGLTLAAWYEFNPNPDLPKDADDIFPFFAASVLPPGLAGLILAALLAATMSSMTSGINALAGSLTFDFQTRLFGQLGPRAELWFGRGVSALIGLAATYTASFVGELGTIFDMSKKMLGTFVGPLAVLMILAVLGRRSNFWVLLAAVLAGCAAGGCITFWETLSGYVAFMGAPPDPLWTTPASALGALIVAWLGSKPADRADSSRE